MTKQQISESLTAARKSGEVLKIKVFSEILSKLMVKEKSGAGVIISEGDVNTCIKKCIKEHQETLSYVIPGGKPEPIRLETEFITELESLLPAAKTETEIREILSHYITDNNLISKDSFGLIMKHVGTYNDIDKGIASRILKEVLV